MPFSWNMTQTSQGTKRLPHLTKAFWKSYIYIPSYQRLSNTVKRPDHLAFHGIVFPKGRRL